MRLADKLKRLSPMPGAEVARQATRDALSPMPEPLGGGEAGRSDERLSRLRAMMGETIGRERRRGAVRPTTGPLPLPVGEACEHPAGSYHRLAVTLEQAHCHGHAPVRAALDVASELVATLALDPSLCDIDLSRMVVLDTETTGLMGGTGTVPFLIGISYFEGATLHVEQLFLRNLGEEAPMLHVLAERIRNASCVVSYNGKSFDWPLLRSRFILNRVQAPELPPHLDLLHCARRLWKGRMEAVRLVDVERELLGFERVDDVDGAQIPGLYLRYLRGEDPQIIVPILKHNQLDVIALPAMLGVMGRHFAEVQQRDDPRDHLAYARVAARAKDVPRALRFAAAAACADGSKGAEGVAAEALHLSGQLEKRAGRLSAAAECFERALRVVVDDLLRAELHLELAKLHEHQTKDFPRALTHAAGTEWAEGAESHGRRCGRLLRRALALP